MLNLLQKNYYMKLFRFFPLIVFLFNFDISNSQIIINEIMATNASILIETDYYNFPDWVEIHNKGASGVALAGYYLSDDKNELMKWQLPLVTLEAKGFFLIYCDKEGTGNHATFGLDAGGDTVHLSG